MLEPFDHGAQEIFSALRGIRLHIAAQFGGIAALNAAVEAERLALEKQQEQQKAAAANKRAKVRAKEEAMSLSLGEVFVVNGLDRLSPDALEGLAIHAARDAQDSKKVDEWIRDGAAARIEREAEQAKARQPKSEFGFSLVKQPSEALVKNLKALGFKIPGGSSKYARLMAHELPDAALQLARQYAEMVWTFDELKNKVVIFDPAAADKPDASPSANRGAGPAQIAGFRPLKAGPGQHKDKAGDDTQDRAGA